MPPVSVAATFSAAPLTENKPALELPPPLESSGVRLQKLEDLPASEQASLQRAIFTAMHAVEPLTEAEAARPENEGVSHFATNRGQSFNALFHKNGGITLTGRGERKTWQGTMRMASSAETPWQETSTRAERSAAEGITEWYENRADGLEHGFTLTSRPADAGEKGFSLEMIVEGLRAGEADAAGEEVMPQSAEGESPGSAGDIPAGGPRLATGDLVLSDPATGEAVLGYRNLKVWDATGRELAANMSPTPSGLRFAVRDEGAVYPVTIDPLYIGLQSRLGEDAAIGTPRTVSIDGDVLAIATDLPIVTVFRRQSGRWAFSGRLTPPAGFPDERFGASVAVGGGLVLVGSPGVARVAPITPNDPPIANVGVVHAYRFSGASWVKENTLYHDEAATRVAPREFGRLVAYDHERDHILISAPGSGSVPGAAPLSFVPTFFLYQGTAAIPLKIIAAPQPVRMAISNGVVAASYLEGAFVFPNIQAISSRTLLQPDHGSAGETPEVDISGNTIVVGAKAAAPEGKVFVFQKSADNLWLWHQTLDPGSAYKQFGTSVAVEGHALMVSSGNGASWFYQRSQESAPWEGEAIVPIQTGARAFPAFVAISPESAVTMLTEIQPSLHFRERVQGAWIRGASVMTGNSRPSDHFGLHVDLDGEVAVVGVLDQDLIGAVNAGCALVFRRLGTDWRAEAKLLPAVAVAHQRFGVAVSVSGNWIAVGSDYDDTTLAADCGSVTIFERYTDVVDGNANKWFRLARLTPAPAGASLGRSVALDGHTVVAGAPKTSGGGSVWAFQGYWDEEGDLRWRTATVGNPLPQAGADFGFSVALSGGRLIVGAPGFDNYLTGLNPVPVNSGGVFFYGLDAGASTLNVAAAGFFSQPTSHSGIGFSVAMDGDVAAAGNTSPAGWFTGAVAQPNGSAYMFTRSGTGWGSGPAATLDAGGFPAGTGTYFGASVAVRGNVAAVGAFGGGTAVGRVRIFQRQGAVWVKQTDVIAPVGERSASDAFGISTALSGDTLLAGAYGIQAAAGAAYVYQVIDPAVTPQPLNIAPSPAVDGSLHLQWPAGTGLALWQSPSGAAGSWVKVPGSENQSTHNHASSSAPRMFFRLAPP